MNLPDGAVPFPVPCGSSEESSKSSRSEKPILRVWDPTWIVAKPEQRSDRRTASCGRRGSFPTRTPRRIGARQSSKSSDQAPGDRDGPRRPAGPLLRAGAGAKFLNLPRLLPARIQRA